MQSITNDYEYKFFLNNGIELNRDNINKDFYTDIYVPIKDKNLANFNYSKIFAEQGYDIYDKNSDFYNDICTPAYLGENDITITDRKKDIYPNNITFCKENCYYNGVNLEEERIICKCNLNNNNNLTEENGESGFFFEEDDGNFISYLLDNINYKIFKCYKLLSSFDNLKNNYAFYTILGVSLVSIIINILFLGITLPKLKDFMYKNSPTREKVRHDTIKALENIRHISKKTFANPPKRKKSTQSLITKKSTKKLKRKKLKNKTKITTKDETFKSPVSKRLISHAFEEDNKNQESQKNEELNDLPYSIAIYSDKRNIFQMFISLIIQKLELINLFFRKEKIKIMIICEYILSLLINFFFNTLLYTDEVVSNKYHNNGELEFIVSLTLSLLSNIITSIIGYYSKYSKGIEERIELIMELKNREYYLKNI